MWPCNYVATWSHVINKKRYISTSPKDMTAKLGKVEIYNKGPQSIRSFDALITWSSDLVTDKKRYISTSSRTIAKKLDGVVGSNVGLLSTKSHNLLITWSQKSYNKWKTLQILFHVTCGYQTWQKGGLWVGVTCLTTKSHIPLSMRLSEVT